MNEETKMQIVEKMKEVIDYNQLRYLEEILNIYCDKEVIDDEVNYLFKFIEAKKVEGCSERSLKYYSSTLENMKRSIKKIETSITTDDIRDYLANYYEKSNCSKLTIDNVRRILSSYFSWLEDENYIIKSPVRRIKKIKTSKTVKEIYSDETLEQMRDNCECKRDLAMVDFLLSTGVRVGELVKLNKEDINFSERECIVYGKGDKERQVYFDARAKVHLEQYLASRKDNNEALFVALNKPYNRLKISGVEVRIRELGKKNNVSAYPHKFRRTLATKAIDKGMPIEQVQRLLGHQKIDTTMHYAMVNQNNVKIAHRKYIG